MAANDPERYGAYPRRNFISGLLSHSDVGKRGVAEEPANDVWELL